MSTILWKRTLNKSLKNSRVFLNHMKSKYIFSLSISLFQSSWNWRLTDTEFLLKETFCFFQLMSTHLSFALGIKEKPIKIFELFWKRGYSNIMNFFSGLQACGLLAWFPLWECKRNSHLSCFRMGQLYGTKQSAPSLFLCRVFYFSSFWCKTSLCPAEFTSNYGDRWWGTCQICEQRSESSHPDSRLRIQHGKACWLETDAFKGHCSFGGLQNQPHHLLAWMWPLPQLLTKESPQVFLSDRALD